MMDTLFVEKDTDTSIVLYLRRVYSTKLSHHWLTSAFVTCTQRNWIALWVRIQERANAANLGNGFRSRQYRPIAHRPATRLRNSGEGQDTRSGGGFQDGEHAAAWREEGRS